MTVLFLDPYGTASLVVKEAKQQGHSCIAVFSSERLAVAFPSDTFDSVIVAESVGWSGAPPPWWPAVAAKGVSGIYFNTDSSFSLAHRLRELSGLPSLSSKVVDRCLNKRNLRLALREAGLSNIATISGDEARSLKNWPFRKAAYFKPVYGSASAYVKRITSLGELRTAIEEYDQRRGADHPLVNNLLGMAANDFHLEEEFNGELLSAESICRNGRGLCLGLLSRILYSKNPIVEMGSCFPYPHPAADSIKSFAHDVHAALGFDEGPSHVEIIINDVGLLEVIDFNPRIVGADVIHSINFAYGIALQEELLDWACNRSNQDVTKLVPSGFSCLQYVLPPEPLVIESFELPQHPQVRYTNSFVKTGQRVSSVEHQTDYLGCYLVFEKSFDQARELSLKLRDQVLINGMFPGSF